MVGKVVVPAPWMQRRGTHTWALDLVLPTLGTSATPGPPHMPPAGAGTTASEELSHSLKSGKGDRPFNSQTPRQDVTTRSIKDMEP